MRNSNQLVDIYIKLMMMINKFFVLRSHSYLDVNSDTFGHLYIEMTVNDNSKTLVISGVTVCCHCSLWGVAVTKHD